MTRQRLDLLLVSRGLAPSRERARALVLAGQVRVNGSAAVKAGTPVAEDADVVVIGPDHPFVGRGGHVESHCWDELFPHVVFHPRESAVPQSGPDTSGRPADIPRTG